jgi:hypothetical protein
METITKLGTFDDVLEATSEDVRQICHALRALICEAHPACVEVPRPGERSSAYGFGEKKMSEAYAYIMPQKVHVNLGFYHGATIAADNPHLEGSGIKLRHIKVRDLESVQSPEVRKALLDAIAERSTALGQSVSKSVVPTDAAVDLQDSANS